MAQYMAEVGSVQGLSYLVDRMKSTKRAPYSMNSGFSIKKVDTATALPLLNKVMPMLAERRTKVSHFERASNILSEWLYDLAGKSEHDLLLVEAFLKKYMKRWKNKPHALADVRWYAARIVENGREHDRTTLNIREIKRAFQQVHWD